MMSRTLAAERRDGAVTRLTTHCRFSRQPELSADQSVVIRVAPDPEPDEVIVNLNGESAVTAPYPR